MFALSKKVDYGLLALAYLSHAAPGRAIRTKEIAERHDIPVELLAKILQRLAKAGLVSSAPGPTGGYALARPASEISIGAVIEAIEGAPAIAHCMKTTHNDCEQHTKCTIRRPLERINARMVQMLNHISLNEING